MTEDRKETPSGARVYSLEEVRSGDGGVKSGMKHTFYAAQNVSFIRDLIRTTATQRTKILAKKGVSGDLSEQVFSILFTYAFAEGVLDGADNKHRDYYIDKIGDVFEAAESFLMKASFVDERNDKDD